MQPRETELIDFPVTRYDAQQGQIVDDHKYTSIERYLDIDLNGTRLTTSFCSPGDLEDLVTGVLAQLGGDDGGRAAVGGPCCGGPALLFGA